MAVEGGQLVEPSGAFDYVVDLGPGELRPGLINAHDHLHRNHLPRLGSPPYSNAYVWGEDLHTRWGEAMARLSGVPRRDALLFGALKNLVAGVTTAVHHDPWQPEFSDSFPLRIARVRVVNSVRFESELYHERLIEALNALPESMFQPGQAVYTYCAAAAAHYREHAQQIKDWYHVTAYGGKEPDQWAGRSLSTN